MAGDESGERLDERSFEDDLSTPRRFVANRKGSPLEARPLPLPTATEITIELSLDVAQECAAAACRARARLVERHPSRAVDVGGYREVRCDRARGHDGDHVAVLHLAPQ